MNQKRFLTLSIAAAMTMGLLAGCGPQEAADGGEELRTVTLSDGPEVTGLPEKVERIGALFGPSYERLYVLDAEDKIALCSTSHKEKWPWGAHVVYDRALSDELPAVFTSDTLNVESLVEYDLDVVFYYNAEEVLKSLANIDIPTVPISGKRDVNSIKEDLRVYAEVVNTPEAMEIYQKYVDYFDSKIEYVKEAVKDIPEAERKSVYVASREILASGMQQTIVDLVEIAGGKPVELNMQAVDPGTAAIDVEQLVAWDPDVIFIDHAKSSKEVLEGDLFTDPRYANLTAVKEQTAYAVPVGTFFWDSGVQMILMVEWMADKMYPEQFEEFDMVEEVKYFYHEFYRYDLTDEQAEMILNCEDPV